MTSPKQPILPGCTDYSQYSLDDLWAMISPADTVSQPQIDGWLTMAILCQDQADTLGRALTNLAEHWPPTPNSASEAFGKLVQGLVASMTDDASAAKKMSGTLSDIVGTLASAKDRMQPLMDQQTHFQQLESATQFPNIAAARLAPRPPDGWRADLHQQATSIMALADARIESLAAAVPTMTTFFVDVPRRVRGGGGGSTDGEDDGHTLLPSIHRPLLNSGVPDFDRQAGGLNPQDLAPSSASAVPGLTTLAGLPIAGRSLQPHVNNLSPPAGTTGEAERIQGVTVANTPAVGAMPSQSSQVDPKGAADVAGIGETARASGGMPMLPPALGGRPPSTTGRSTSRPGGRAALWYSQRQQKRDSKDPWSVRHGVPPIIEAPPEPTDHDPGPGVIGIDA
jgi:hypothetical protein